MEKNKSLYVGHVSQDGENRRQLLQEHLKNVAQLSGEFASFFAARNDGYQIGLLHDVGKYSAGFQKRILQNGPKVDHSTAGGKWLINGQKPIK